MPLPHPRFRATLFCSEATSRESAATLRCVLEVCVGPSLHGRARKSTLGFSWEGKPLPQGCSWRLLRLRCCQTSRSHSHAAACVLVYRLSRPCPDPCILAAHVHRQAHTPNSQSHATCTRAHTRPQNAPHLYTPPSHQHVHTDADTHTPIHTHTHSPGGSPSPGALYVPPPYMSSPWWCWHLCCYMCISCAQPCKLTVSFTAA